MKCLDLYPTYSSPFNQYIAESWMYLDRATTVHRTWKNSPLGSINSGPQPD
jgi:hypothetical protein